MITDLENLLNQETFLELLEAVRSNQEYCYSENGLTIKAIPSDHSLCLDISYEDVMQKELDTFKNYIESLDDDLFLEICESLGETELQKIQECLSSNNIDSIRAGVFKFKQATKVIFQHKLQYLTEQLNSL